MWKVVWKNEIKSLFITSAGLVVGSFIMACSTAFFLLPNKLSTGGFSGLSTIAYYLFHVPVGNAMILLNLPLFIIAFFRVGKKFFIKSVFGTVLLAVFINILERFPAATTDKLLACIYGGIIMGIGTAIILPIKKIAMAEYNPISISLKIAILRIIIIVSTVIIKSPDLNLSLKERTT